VWAQIKITFLRHCQNKKIITDSHHNSISASYIRYFINEDRRSILEYLIYAWIRDANSRTGASEASLLGPNLVV